MKQLSIKKGEKQWERQNIKHSSTIRNRECQISISNLVNFVIFFMATIGNVLISVFYLSSKAEKKNIKTK